MAPKIGSTRTRNGNTYISTEGGVVKLPPSARTPRQRIMWLLRRGYLLAAYLVAAHGDKVMVALLKRAKPNVPWNNIHAAAKYA